MYLIRDKAGSNFEKKFCQIFVSQPFNTNDCYSFDANCNSFDARRNSFDATKF